MISLVAKGLKNLPKVKKLPNLVTLQLKVSTKFTFILLLGLGWVQPRPLSNKFSSFHN